MKRLGITVALISLLPGCFWGRSSPTPPSTPQPRNPSFSGLLLVLTARPQGPEGRLLFRGIRREGRIGSNCWHQDATAVRCEDFGPDVMVPRSYVDVPRGTTITLQTDARTVDASLALLRGGQGKPDLANVARLSLRRDGDVATIDVPVGFYTLSAHGTWGRGEAPFYFGLRVT